jgi:hypothetical protein
LSRNQEPRNQDRTAGQSKMRIAAFALFPLAIFASAFLIFLVQPMVGKHILPWFGGSPGVWNLCLAFYQSTLFLGYAYAHFLIKKVPARQQFWVHISVIACAFSVLPVLPGVEWKPAGLDAPSWRIISMLSGNVALPFLALASTGPLVQAWFARRFPENSPYPLYAVSNVGSLLALVAYPFLVEPRLELSAQSNAWTLGFALTAIAILLCAWLARTDGVESREAAAPSSDDSLLGSTPTPFRVALWLLLPAGAVILLMGITNELCLDVASVPFLWIVPLAVYLLTFIVCFASERTYHRVAFGVLAAAALGFYLVINEWDLVPKDVATLARSLPTQMSMLLLLLFSGCMLMHGELYRLRPPPRSLTTFYLCVSGGGALGGLFVGLLAPEIFSDYHELSAGLIACWTFFLAAWWQSSEGWAVARRRQVLVSQSVVLLAVAGSMLARSGEFPDSLVLQERNFFGILRLLEFDTDKPARHRHNLKHGTTVHGSQFQSAELRRIPTAYFGRVTGIGLTLDSGLSEGPRDVGIIGLGIGTLASYGRPGDAFTFYEIDPNVIRLAQDSRYFDYLEQSAAEIKIVQGDARLALEAEISANDAPQYDILVLDAFTSDAIPVHLLTLEAFRLYARHLRPGGILAANISNRYMNLTPLILRLGMEVGMHGVNIVNHNHPNSLSMMSEWIVLSRDEQVIRDYQVRAERRRAEYGLEPGRILLTRLQSRRIEAAPLWTDGYSDIFGVLRRKHRWGAL